MSVGLGSREYRIVIPDAVREWAEGQWMEVEGIKLVFSGDYVEVYMTTDLANTRRAESEPRVAARPASGNPVRWR